MENHTFFYLLATGERIASAKGLLAIPLFAGMLMTIHGLGSFTVETWTFHHGHEDEEAGLRIYLRQHTEQIIPSSSVRDIATHLPDRAS